MTTHIPALLLSVLLVAGCSPAPDSGDSANDLRPTATIRDIMGNIIDPSADAIWESVSMYVDQDGLHESYPQTDEEWAAVRRDAILIVEGSNLLLMRGRAAAAPGSRTEFPEVELEPEEIEALIESDWQKFVDLAHGLHDAAMVTLRATDARDKDALYSSGEGLDVACERCHITYWYPNDARAREVFEENERIRNQPVEGETR